MTSLLFDTNALIYWIHPDSSFHEEALCLVEEAYINRSTICALSSSLNDVYYILCRHYMTEEEAHRYLQKCSMDSGTNMLETAQMVLTIMSE